MREILFRGKCINTGNWINGCLVNNMFTYSEHSEFKKGEKVCEIITGDYESDNWEEAIQEENNLVRVIPESVGQFTGLTDKNGTKVFENDIIEFQNTEGEGLIKKVWYCDKMHSVMIGNLIYSTITESGFFKPSQLIFEVIGNFNDNPELLK
jgi:hypothetical protein